MWGDRGSDINEVCSEFSESIPPVKDRTIVPITQTQSRILISDITEHLSVISKGRESPCTTVIGDVFGK